MSTSSGAPHSSDWLGASSFGGPASDASYPVQVRISPRTTDRNRLTVGFRLLLALPHLLLVGGPLALTLSWGGRPEPHNAGWEWGGGLLGAVAFMSAVIAWFALVFGGRHPDGLWTLARFYLQWRVRAVSYVALLLDEYPPFGEGPYPAGVEIRRPPTRNRLTAAFRPILVLPHLIAVWVLGCAWLLTTLVAWFAILFTGRYPEGLYRFGVGVLRWNTRVEAYALLLDDAYPPFSLD